MGGCVAYVHAQIVPGGEANRVFTQPSSHGRGVPAVEVVLQAGVGIERPGSKEKERVQATTSLRWWLRFMRIGFSRGSPGASGRCETTRHRMSLGRKPEVEKPPKRDLFRRVGHYTTTSLRWWLASYAGGSGPKFYCLPEMGLLDRLSQGGQVFQAMSVTSQRGRMWLGVSRIWAMVTRAKASSTAAKARSSSRCSGHNWV